MGHAAPSFAFVPNEKVFCSLEASLTGSLFDIDPVITDAATQRNLNSAQPNPVIGDGIECGYQELNLFSDEGFSRLTADFFSKDTKHFVKIELTMSIPDHFGVFFFEPATYFFQQSSDGSKVQDFKLVDSDLGSTLGQAFTNAELKDFRATLPENFQPLLEQIGEPVDMTFTSRSLTVNLPTVLVEGNNASAFALFEIVFDDSATNQTSVPELDALLSLVGMFILGVMGGLAWVFRKPAGFNQNSSD